MLKRPKIRKKKNRNNLISVVKLEIYDIDIKSTKAIDHRDAKLSFLLLYSQTRIQKVDFQKIHDIYKVCFQDGYRL